jgi:hypothetical protein
MRLLVDTSVRWLIAGGLYVGAISYFRVPAATHLESIYIDLVATALVIGPMLVVSAIALEGSILWFASLIIAASMSFAFCAYHQISGNIDFGSETINIGATIVVVSALLLITSHVFARTHRFLLLLNCWCDPDQLKTWIADLESADLRRKQLAVRTMADYLGRPLAVFEDWSFTGYGAVELDSQATILKKLWEAKQAMMAECPSQGPLLEQLGRRMKESYWRLIQCRLDWLVTQISEYFQGSEASPDASQASETAEPLSLPPLEPERLIESMLDRITKSLQRIAQILNDAPAGSLIVDSESPVGESLAQLFLEAYQTALLLRIEGPGISRPASPSQPDVWSLDTRGHQHLRSAFQLFGQVVKRAGNEVRQTLMDLNLLAEEISAQSTGEDHPFMSQDEFVLAMRPHVEQALKRFADITNQSLTGLILVAEEAVLCRIFVRLHARALETGLELRLRRAENLGFFAKPMEEDVATPHLRKAASPPLPPPLMGWAEKYRSMKIAGTRFPLLREERRKTMDPDEHPVTSAE